MNYSDKETTTSDVSTETKAIEKPFLTVDEQIDLLESRNLKIINRNKFFNYLSVNNYNALVNGYNDPFFLNFDRKTNTYDNYATSESIIDLFNYDRAISSRILSNIQNIERQFATFLSRTICEKMYKLGYKNCLILDNNFNLSIIFKKPKNETKTLYEYIRSITSRNVDFRFDYLKQYNSYRKIPIWVLSLTWSFGDLIKIFECLNNNFKYEIIRNFKYIDLNINEFLTIMKILKNIRNIAAHNNVLYSSNFILFTESEMMKFISRNKIDISINEKNIYGIYDIVRIIDKILNNCAYGKIPLQKVLNMLTEKMIIGSKNISKESCDWILSKIKYKK